MTTEPQPGDSIIQVEIEHLNEGNSHPNNNKPTLVHNYMLADECFKRLPGPKNKLLKQETDTTNKTMERNNIPIPKVPLWLRENKAYSECFDPAVVSIGPYHHGNPKLARIEELKFISAQRFVTNYESSMNDIYRTLEPLTSEAKMYYDGSIMANVNNEAFTVMMLLDGCFILDFIQQVKFGGEWNMLMTSGNDIPLISRDLFLLENQLPYIILKKLVECDSNLESMVNNYINSEIRKTYGKCGIYSYINSEIGETSMLSPSVGQNDNQKMRSLPCIVDLFRAKLVSKSFFHSYTRQKQWERWEQERRVRREQWEQERREHKRREQERRDLHKQREQELKELQERWEWERPERQEQEQWERWVRCMLWVVRWVLQVLLVRWVRWERRERRERSEGSYPPVKELLAMGITFKRTNSICLCDVEFRTHLLSGELLLPQIEINHYTKDRFLNLIAYELSYDIPEDRAFIAFICFLDTLIDHADDVKVLRSKGIICNYLGSDEEVANLINQLATGLPRAPAYSEVIDEIQSHLQNKWKVYIGEFMHTYFHSPWTTIALIAAGYVILLTSIQTFYTVFPR